MEISQFSTQKGFRDTLPLAPQSEPRVEVERPKLGQEQDLAALEEEKKKQESLEGVPVSESSQKTPDQLLSELNSSMNQLVQLATTQTMLAKKQLGVTGENVGDLYGAV